MTAGRGERRPIKIRRRGRHTTPSQVEKVAQQAGKAAPAFAIAGALVASPAAQHAVGLRPATVAAAQAHQHAILDSISTRGNVARAATTRHAAARSAARNIYYRVQTGDTLSSIADRYYHNAGDWPGLYQANEKTVQNPNLIYTGERLFIPTYLPKHAAQYAPKHARTDAVTQTSETREGQGGSVKTATTVTDITGKTHRHGGWRGSGNGSGVPSGQLGCKGLEQLWDDAGGNPSDAFMAAEIAMAESGGDQYALSPTADYGYWQINASHGSQATFDPWGNARAAIAISGDGTDWSPWTTYTSGAYAGQC